MAAEASPLREDLLTALLEHARALEQLGLRYALIGGLATGYRSRPRTTQDLDFLLDVPQLALPGLLDDLHARGFSFDTTTIIREWTQHHVAVLSYHQVRVDWLKPVLPIYQHVLDSARPESWLGCTLRIASPEGLILTKLIAFRSQDQADIEKVLAANRGQLDLEFIRREWQTVASLDEHRLGRFETMVAQYYLPPPPDAS
jgi:predicted nucleotidyltransferase